MDLAAACAHKIDVVEITGSNSVSVAEHEVMALLSLVRNFIPSHHVAAGGGWNIAECVSRAFDLEGMDVGTLGAGRIGLAAMRRLAPFGVKLHCACANIWIDQPPLSPAISARRRQRPAPFVSGGGGGAGRRVPLQPRGAREERGRAARQLPAAPGH